MRKILENQSNLLHFYNLLIGNILYKKQVDTAIFDANDQGIKILSEAFSDLVDIILIGTQF
jgi:hypothetical protein